MPAKFAKKMINENVRRYFFDTLFNINRLCKGQEEAGTYSLVISEIMADPHPAVALPDAEYLEIYNRGPSPVSACRLQTAFW